MQLATLLFEETRFREALDAYRKAIDADDSDLALRARIGFVPRRCGLAFSRKRSAKPLR